MKYIQKIVRYLNTFTDFNLLRCITKNRFFSCKSATQVQHGMGPLINMQKSVFLPLWDNYELYSRKILHITSFSDIESENLVRISIFLYERSMHAQLPRMIN